MADPPLGEQYQEVLTFDAGVNADVPTAAARTIGDLIDPLRPGDMTTVINVVTQATGQDAADWTVGRLFGMLEVLEASVPE